MVQSDRCISYGLRDGRAVRLGPKLFDQPTRDRLRNLLDEAARRADSDDVKQRIQPIRNAFDACETSVLELSGS